MAHNRFMKNKLSARIGMAFAAALFLFAAHKSANASPQLLLPSAAVSVRAATPPVKHTVPYRNAQADKIPQDTVLPRYAVYCDGKWEKMTIRELAAKIRLPADERLSRHMNTGALKVWSARLSTGLFGHPGCPSGNKGPKGSNEVILAVGDDGLKELVRLGFIPCPSCRPENTPGFWGTLRTIEKSILDRHKLASLEQFSDKKLVPFDARRLAWEELFPVVGGMPVRLYLPPGLSDNDLRDLKNRFSAAGVPLPQAGVYDRTAEGSFRPYIIPSEK